MVRAKPTSAATPPTAEALGRRPRLEKLTIRNFRCIGASPVVVHLDDIVVLVGPNNVGKSTVLKAYEVIMSEAGKDGELTLEDFPSGKVDDSQLPEIELDTIVYDNSPGEKWIETTPAGEKRVRERWTWPGPGKANRRGYNVELGRWANDEDKEKVPWGAAGIASSRRPQPHRVEAFASPEDQSKQIVKLLTSALQERVKAHQAVPGEGTPSEFGRLIEQVAQLQKKIVAEASSEIHEFEGKFTEQVAKVFPGYKVEFDARPEDALDKAVSLFKADAQLLMGPADGHLSTLDRQGSGARRTLLWVAIRLLAEADAAKKAVSTQRPFVLLLDEPELCLHPGAIREACNLLYDLPHLTGNWQVMVTTHSPCFIDFARDHTSVVRVERTSGGDVTGTTIFRPEAANFDGDDRSLLKLLNMCDPYVAEFFFGGRTVLVEGDTEYTAFKHVMARSPQRYGAVHIVRARGKATLVALAKILNQFGAPYSVLHDSDRPTYMKAGTVKQNPAWALNDSIRQEVGKATAPARLVASLPNFEQAYLGQEAKGEKPYSALAVLQSNGDALDRVSKLLAALVDFGKTPPEGATEWRSLDQLRDLLPAEDGSC
jgi:putative ATP-dependent endonuclease of the OLD family